MITEVSENCWATHILSQFKGRHHKTIPSSSLFQSDAAASVTMRQNALDLANQSEKTLKPRSLSCKGLHEFERAPEPAPSSQCAAGW
jgi:hypothetical protein